MAQAVVNRDEVGEARARVHLRAPGTALRLWRVRDPACGRGSARAIELGCNIAAQRRERGWSQAALARAVGCDHSAVSRWESGQRLPTLGHLLAIGRVLGCGGAALLPDESSSRGVEESSRTGFLLDSSTPRLLDSGAE